MRTRHRAVRTWYMTIPSAYMSAAFVGVHFSSPNLDGKRSSGAMKRVAHLPTMGSKDSVPGLESHTMVANSKPLRHAVTGLAFVIRILA